MADVVTRIGNGVYRVETDGTSRIVYVAGPRTDRWAFWNGRLFRATGGPKSRGHDGRVPHEAVQRIEAPMPAVVTRVLVETGAAVKKGETLVLLEAMKMELPMRAGSDAMVTAVLCREGERVEAGALLVELR
jgi:biotin carboxyl carrier protein